MTTATLSDMQTRVRQRAGMESSQFVTDAELANYINEAASELYGILESYDSKMFAAVSSNLTLSGSNTFDLTSELSQSPVRIIGVDYQSGSRWLPMRPYQFWKRGDFGNTPSADGTYRVWYVPEQVLLASSGDKLHDAIPRDLDAFVVAVAAMKCLVKEESNTASIEREIQRLERRVHVFGARRASQRHISDDDGIDTSNYLGGDTDRVWHQIGDLMYVYAVGWDTYA